MQNKYDDSTFFEKYSQMTRSVHGLQGAGEWHELRKLMPDFPGKRVLDLGCGFGWHCRYAAEHGAKRVVGIDLSERMLDKARALSEDFGRIEYRQGSIEQVEFEAGTFDVVISSLALHYVEDFPAVCRKVREWLAPGGAFVFSVEHPIFTAQGQQDWAYGQNGEKLHWPVDRYFLEGQRDAVFLGEQVTKYHRTLTSYVQGLMGAGFQLTGLVEPQPEPSMMANVPGMEEELRRPMMLLLSATKIDRN